MNGTRVTPLGGVLSQSTLPARSGLIRPARQTPGRARRVRLLWTAPSAALRALQERFHHWRLLAQQRRQLARLDERMLKDIGLTRSDAHREAHKWFWQI